MPKNNISHLHLTLTKEIFTTAGKTTPGKMEEGERGNLEGM
jgi:hypothetical protein